MIRINGSQSCLRQLDKLIGVDEVFDKSLLNTLKLTYEII